MDRAAAKGVFGSPTRIALLVWARQRDKAFFQSEPPPEVGPATQVRAELERLVALGMFTATANPAERRTYYEIETGPLWRIVDAAAAALGD
jgi:hypothetical protein